MSREAETDALNASQEDDGWNVGLVDYFEQHCVDTEDDGQALPWAAFERLLEFHGVPPRNRKPSDRMRLEALGRRVEALLASEDAPPRGLVEVLDVGGLVGRRQNSLSVWAFLREQFLLDGGGIDPNGSRESTLLQRQIFPIPDETFYRIPERATHYVYRRLVDGPAVDFWSINGSPEEVLDGR